MENIHFSSKKLIETGFEFKYSLEDMFVGAVDDCKTKGLLPPNSEKHEADETNAVHVK